MCYFLVIGAAAYPWRLAAMLEEQLRLDVTVTDEQSDVAAAFHSEDVVRLVTHQGCSCRFLRPLPAGFSTSRVSLTPDWRQVVARAVKDFRSVRLCVRAEKNFSQGCLPRLVVTLDEFLRGDAVVPANALVEIFERVPPEFLN